MSLTCEGSNDPSVVIGDTEIRDMLHCSLAGYVLKSQMKELLEEEAKNAKDVTEQIEEERSKVQARTPVTQETFKAWHAMKADAKRKAREEVEQERRKKGILNGREIFMQVLGRGVYALRAVSSERGPVLTAQCGNRLIEIECVAYESSRGHASFSSRSVQWVVCKR